MTYEEWSHEVDEKLLDLCGMTQDDLPDWLSMDAYSDGATPREGAVMCLENAGVDHESLIDEG